MSLRLVADVERQRANPTATRLDRLAKGLGLSGISELLALAEDAATAPLRAQRTLRR